MRLRPLWLGSAQEAKADVMTRIFLTAACAAILNGCAPQIPTATLTTVDTSGKYIMTLPDMSAGCLAQAIASKLTEGGYQIRSASNQSLVAQRASPKDLSRDERATYTFEQLGSSTRVTAITYQISEPDTATEQATLATRNANAVDFFEWAIKRLAASCAPGNRL